MVSSISAFKIFDRPIKIIKPIFTLDTRSLSVFRIFVGLSLFIDTITRMSDVEDHYTDAGIFPVEIANVFIKENGWFSLHTLSGEAWLQYLLFSVALATSISIILGLKSKIFFPLGWVLFISVQNRFFPSYPGDYLLQTGLFWGTFLPLDHHFGIRNILKKEMGKAEQLFNVATVGVALHYLLFMFFAFLTKTGSWYDGTALSYMLNIKRFTKGNLEWALEYELLLMFATYFVMVMECLAPLLAVFPYKNHITRTIGSLFMVSAVPMFGLDIGLHFLGVIGVGAFSTLIPSFFWDNVLKWKGSKAFSHYSPSKYRLGVASIALIYLLSYEVVRYAGLFKIDLSLPSNVIVDAINRPADLARLKNPWHLFRNPQVIEDGWDIIEGVEPGGKRYNLLTKKKIDTEVPEDITAYSGGFRWRRYFRITGWFTAMGMHHERVKKYYHPSLGRFFCTTWAQRNQVSLEKIIQYKAIRANPFRNEENPGEVTLHKVVEIPCN